MTSENSWEVNPFAPPEEEPFENVFAPESSNISESQTMLYQFTILNHMNISENVQVITPLTTS